MTNRVRGSRAHLARRPPFIEAMAEHGHRVDPSTVSRWESGGVAVSDETVSRYEVALGRPSGSLVAVVSGLRRVFGVDTAIRQDGSDDPLLLADLDLEELCDRAAAGSAGGDDWITLTRQLMSYDRVHLHRDEWADLASQIVAELSTSVGFGLLRRYEAAVDFLRRTEASRHVTEAVEAFVKVPDVQSAWPVISLLTEVDDPFAGQLAIRLLDSGNPVVRLSAAWAAAAKLGRDQRAGLSISRVESHVRHGLEYGDSLSDSLESADLAVQLPRESWARIVSDVRAEHEVQVVERARSSGALMSSERAWEVVGDMAPTVLAETPSHVPITHDTMLTTMLREALLHADSSRRHHAARTLAATPYAASIARQCRALAHTELPVLAARVHELLFVFGGEEAPPTAVKEALAEPREAIRARALVTSGLRPAGLPEDDQSAVADHTVEAPGPLDRATGLFALGMSGSDSLDKLLGHDVLGAAARWWSAIGPARRDADDDGIAVGG